MGKITVDQSHQIMAILATNINWSVIDFEKSRLQDLVIRDPKGAGERFALFLQNGARVNIAGNMKITPKPFDPVKFIGKDWSLVADEHDARNDTLIEVDFMKVSFETCLKEGEIHIKGEEKLKRMKENGKIRLGATVFIGLWKDYQMRKDNSVLEHLYREKRITYMDFFGDVLLDPDGDCHVLYLLRNDGGWYWYYSWLERGWYAVYPSASLAS